MRALTSFLIALFVAAAASLGARAQDMTLVMDGARYWSQNCTRCHNARSPLERTDREWVTIVQHMRARGNLTRAEAVAVSAFLQSSNGTPSNVPASQDSPANETNPQSSEVPERSGSEFDRADTPPEQVDRTDTARERVEPHELRRVRVFLEERYSAYP